MAAARWEAGPSFQDHSCAQSQERLEYGANERQLKLGGGVVGVSERGKGGQRGGNNPLAVKDELYLLNHTCRKVLGAETT